MQDQPHQPAKDMPPNSMLKTFLGLGEPLERPDPALLNATGMPTAAAAGVSQRAVTTHGQRSRPDSAAVDALLLRAGINDDLLLDEYNGRGASTTSGALEGTTVTDAGCGNRLQANTDRLSLPTGGSNTDLPNVQLTMHMDPEQQV